MFQNTYKYDIYTFKHFLTINILSTADFMCQYNTTLEYYF